MRLRRPGGNGATEVCRRPAARELSLLADALRAETIGGGLLLGAVAVALVLANTGAHNWYAGLQHFAFGPAALLLHMSLESWAADGLLAIFFFVAGLELKRELVAGEMRRATAAAVPVAAAIGGMVLPSLIYLAINLGRPTVTGWAIPSASDLALALAVLAVTGRFLPAALRAFLLTLVVVEDIGAIIVIAVAYTGSIRVIPLVCAGLLLVMFWLLQRIRLTFWWLTVPLALVIWALVHAAAVHATVAGVALGLLIPVRASDGEQAPAERLEHLIRPLSAGLAVPAFALLSAGITVSGDTLRTVVTGPIGLGVLAGLVVGKPAGVFGSAYLTARFTRAHLSAGLDWADILAVAVLSGIGFTVSLLISDLAFGPYSAAAGVAKMAVLVASVLASAFACALLLARNKHYRRLRIDETAA
ncbi:MAG TPA: Na+/H+ antiporter NhaA [Streptosporangiaceae bacterium]|nr:Na+/H+ antiporter NhaA [Streptosporangiaceae bacterium]